MKSGVAFIVFIIVLLVRDAKGQLSFDDIKNLLFPRDPELHRVRRIEDANGDPYAFLDTVGLVEQHGYPAEEHNLTTEDGYNLVFFRVPGSPKSPPTKGKPVVFIQHGLTGCSDNWVFMGPDHDLVFLLADVGYDVWLGNIRGNSYCRSNTNLSTTDKQFWDFSWQDAGTIDVPNMIDYALEFSGQKNMFYVGFSMGSTMSYVLLSERPEYNDKMRLLISLAPAGCFKHELHVPNRLLLEFNPLVTQMCDALGVYELVPQRTYNSVLGEALCRNGSPTQPLCLAFVTAIVGRPNAGFDTANALNFAKYNLAGMSEKTLRHFVQCNKSGVFKKFDYGPIKNLRIYGTKEPPVYNLSKVSAPCGLFYGNTDEVSISENAVELSKLLPNVVTCEAVPTDAFNHIDFYLSTNARDLVYKRIIDLLSKY